MIEHIAIGHERIEINGYVLTIQRGERRAMQAVYLYLPGCEGKASARTDSYADGNVNVDYGEDGYPIGLEVL